MNFGNCFIRFLCAVSVLYGFTFQASIAENTLPPFGRNTVLVWKAQSTSFEECFTVRIAEFSPDRYVEWENEKTQGTIFMPEKDVQEAKGFVDSSLFVAGVDKKSKDTMTLWLSRRVFLELKEKKKAKCVLDGVSTWLTYEGDDHLTVEVNKTPLELPAIRVKDDRGSERWFLDREDNPLLLKHAVRTFNQTLISITTDKLNTLRWIKGVKLRNLPH